MVFKLHNMPVIQAAARPVTVTVSPAGFKFRMRRGPDSNPASDFPGRGRGGGGGGG